MDRDAGSVFIETLVAALIVALVIGMAFRTITDTASRSQRVEQRRTALLMAQSRLALVGDAIPVARGTTEGAELGYLWSVAVEPRSGMADSLAGPLADVTVRVRTAAGGKDLAVLRTVRVGGAG